MNCTKCDSLNHGKCGYCEVHCESTNRQLVADYIAEERAKGPLPPMTGYGVRMACMPMLSDEGFTPGKSVSTH